MRPLLPNSSLAALDKAHALSTRARSWPTLSLRKYLTLVSRAYDAAFPEMRGLPVRKKHRSKADGRHGGLLDLPPNDGDAFGRWYHSKEWLGCHPWEIVFSHPHGVLFSPLPDEAGGWRFHLSVDAPGLYLRTVKMAVALGNAKVPLALIGKEPIVAALRGTDDVEIGPGFDQMSLERLREVRPDAVTHVRWEPIPEIHPITKAQRDRVRHVLTTGTPHGWPPGQLSP
jgi:hypothetical protein